MIPFPKTDEEVYAFLEEKLANDCPEFSKSDVSTIMDAIMAIFSVVRETLELEPTVNVLIAKMDDAVAWRKAWKGFYQIQPKVQNIPRWS